MLPEPPTIRQVLDRANLERAWFQVRANQGAPGVDEVSVARWERHWQENLDRLSHQVRTSTCKPSRPRRFRVLKKNGGYRELSILTVSDRVLQRAALNALEPACERLFLNGSYGYRAERSVAHVVEQTLQARDRGWEWVVDADIHDCFNQLPHAVILEQVRRLVSNRTLLRLIEQWLALDARRGPKAQPAQRIGIALGAVISPVLCNLALHPLDEALERGGWRWLRYADDFVVLARSADEAWRAWDAAEQALAALGLRLNPEKSRLTTFAEGFTFLGVTFKGDTYSFVYNGRTVTVKGRNVTVLWNHIPDGYRDW